MGSYRCLCPKGFTSKNPGQKCIDVNECISEKKPCSHECHNIEGSFYCSCPKEMNLKSDGLTCENQEISYTSSKIVEKPKITILDLLPDYHVIPLLKTKPPVHFWSITNNDDEIQSILNAKEISKNRSTSGWFDHADYQKCPTGYVSRSGKCEDIDECMSLNRNPKMRHPHQKASPCPLSGQQCINTKGSFHCVEMSCTIGFEEVEVDFAYQNESLRYCLQLCGSEGLPCQEKAEIAEIIVNAIVTVNALRPRLALAQFSVPITAKNEKNQTSTVASTTRTTFHKLDEESASSSKQLLQLFRVRSEGTEGILYSMKEFKLPGLYR
ncbi:hypothetical protein J437_LFUL006388 [Ladona fulva]|uniref:EGF-like domain-containing protein n=1 Tax=Ladona fulva TaxID=123851 RepID=A0A8K0K0J1_LADFU|nr:hypothetical protein J437_LFUL006388 [Ladona fulva]